MTFNEFVTGHQLSPYKQFDPLSYKLVERTASCSAWGFFFCPGEIQYIICHISTNALKALCRNTSPLACAFMPIIAGDDLLVS